MDYQPPIFFTAIGLVGYVVWHGHRLNNDCWLCPYRGIAFMGGSVVLGIIASWDS